MTDDVTAARHETVLRLRREGQTFAQIGAAMGVSRSRAEQIYTKARKREATLARWSDEVPTPDTPIEQLTLSDRTFECLRREGLKTFSDAIELLEADPSELMRRPGFGRIEREELQALISANRLWSNAKENSDNRHDGQRHDCQRHDGQRHDGQISDVSNEQTTVFGASAWEQHATLIGMVTLGWNRNVHQLLRVFTHLTGIESPVADAIFFSSQSDSSQRRLIERVAGAVGVAVADKKSLHALLKRLETVSKGRNLAAQTIFGLSASDPLTGQWAAKVVPELDPPEDHRLEADFVAQFKKAKAELDGIFLALDGWLTNTPYPARPWTGPPLPLAAAEQISKRIAEPDFSLNPHPSVWPDGV